MAFYSNLQDTASGYLTPTPPVFGYVTGCHKTMANSESGQCTPDRVAGFHLDTEGLAARLKQELSRKNADQAETTSLPRIPYEDFAGSGLLLKTRHAAIEIDSANAEPHAEMPGVPQSSALPPPPAQHPVPRPSKKQALGADIGKLVNRISLGTVGHPVSCAEACKYVKRKGGCRDGANCLKCHECFWSRDAKEVGAEDATESSKTDASIGTLGHPYNCSEPCKYFKRKGGCKYGTQCEKCHKCHWQRKPSMETNPSFAPSKGVSANSEELNKMTGTKDPRAMLPLHDLIVDALEPQQPVQFTQVPLLAMPVTMFSPPPGLEAPAPPPSLGSIGHPQNCGAACKFAYKPKGCKDGQSCVHCHLCHWNRNGVKTEHVSMLWLTHREASAGVSASHLFIELC